MANYQSSVSTSERAHRNGYAQLGRTKDVDTDTPPVVRELQTLLDEVNEIREEDQEQLWAFAQDHPVFRDQLGIHDAEVEEGRLAVFSAELESVATGDERPISSEFGWATVFGYSVGMAQLAHQIERTLEEHGYESGEDE